MSNQPVAKALIPAAGLGTRFLPATKAVPKELLPLGRRPVIHWLIEEAARAGVREVVVVIGPAKQAIKDYLGPDPALQEYLAARGKLDLLADLHRLQQELTFTFVHQDAPRGLGHAVLCGRRAIGDAPFLVLLGDAPILARTPVCRQLTDRFAEVDATVIGLREVPAEKTGAYGIVAGKELAPDFLQLHELIEKPSPQRAPSRLAIAGRYLLTPTIFELLAKQEPGIGGEIQLTDAIAGLLTEEDVFGCVYEGERFDIGDPEGYLAAQQAYASQPEAQRART